MKSTPSIAAISCLVAAMAACGDDQEQKAEILDGGAQTTDAGQPTPPTEAEILLQRALEGIGGIRSHCIGIFDGGQHWRSNYQGDLGVKSEGEKADICDYQMDTPDGGTTEGSSYTALEIESIKSGFIRLNVPANNKPESAVNFGSVVSEGQYGDASCAGIPGISFVEMEDGKCFLGEANNQITPDSFVAHEAPKAACITFREALGLALADIKGAVDEKQASACFNTQIEVIACGGGVKNPFNPSVASYEQAACER